MRRQPLITALFCFLLMAIILLFPACRAEPLAPQEPILVLLSPSYGSQLAAGPVVIKNYVENFTLVEAAGQSNAFAQGHVIYYLDVDVPIKPGSSALTAPGTWISSAQTFYTWNDVTPGQHTFAVQLVNNDDTPLTAPVTQRVVVDVVSQ